MLTALVVLAHVIPGLRNSFVDANVRDGLHILGFAVVAAVVFELTSASLIVNVLSALVVAIAIGVFSEYAQTHTGQAFDEYDILRDAAGAAVYLTARSSWAWSSQPARIQLSRVTGRIAALFIGALVLMPLLYWSAVKMSYRDRLPIVLDFAEAMDSQLVAPINSHILSVSESGIAEIFLERPRWSGVLVSVAASDWSGYQSLVVRLSMHGAPETRFSVELSDGAHVGYRMQHLIGGDPVSDTFREVRFPLRGIRDVPGRPDLNVSNIEKIWVLGKHDGTTAVMRLNKIWLE
jgi:hypothetical protein